VGGGEGDGVGDDVAGGGDDGAGAGDDGAGAGDEVDCGLADGMGARPPPDPEPVGVVVGAVPTPPVGTPPDGPADGSPTPVSGGAVGLFTTVGEGRVGTADCSLDCLRPGNGSRSPGLTGPPARLKPSSSTYPMHSAPATPRLHITHARRLPDSSTNTGE
jgi:hypothetical protein